LFTNTIDRVENARLAQKIELILKG
jgi:hypothetical protein